MAKRTQASRFVAISTPLGEDVLLLRSASIREELGRPFQIEADLLSENHEIDFKAIVGKPAAVRLQLGNGQSRYFHGLVAQFSQEGLVGELTSYRATIVPWIWLLTKASDCAIFQAKSVPDIVQEIFRDYPDGKLSLATTGTYDPREFVVQYRETDFNFVSRLMEHEGITYFFEHTKEHHTLVLADNPGAYSPFEGFETIRFSRDGGDRADEQQSIRTWTMTTSMTPAVVALKDFDPLIPARELLAKTQPVKESASGTIFDYPGDFLTAAQAESYANMRLDELRTPHQVVRGTGNARGIAVGHVFELADPPRGDLAGKKWLVTSASYQITGDDFGASAGGGGESFSVAFTAVEHSIAYRPARTTPRPVISGPQTAIVVGTSGEELTVDQHGRVKLKFHWDRYAEGNENDSCWVRVSQSWAGKAWGSIFTPRHGQEVIVEFLEGDPDRPIITGRVYNGENATPYALPDNKTISGLKTSTSKGGGGFNELRFEDKQGSELVYLQAQKDLNVRTLNDESSFVGNDRHTTVKRDDLEMVEQDRGTTVKRDRTVEIGRDESVTIKGKEKREVTGTQSLTVKEDAAVKYSKNCAIETTQQFHIKAEEIVLEASKNLTIKVGGTTIAIEPSGIAIDSKGDVQIQAATDVKIEGKSSFAAEGAQASVKGKAGAKLESTGQTVVKGTMVMIN